MRSFNYEGEEELLSRFGRGGDCRPVASFPWNVVSFYYKGKKSSPGNFKAALFRRQVACLTWRPAPLPRPRMLAFAPKPRPPRAGTQTPRAVLLRRAPAALSGAPGGHLHPTKLPS
jgi:hypothetical protein